VRGQLPAQLSFFFLVEQQNTKKMDMSIKSRHASSYTNTNKVKVRLRKAAMRHDHHHAKELNFDLFMYTILIDNLKRDYKRRKREREREIMADVCMCHLTFNSKCGSGIRLES